MKAAALLLVFSTTFGMTVMFCEGRIGGATERCLCKRTNLHNRVRPAFVKRVEVFFPSASCSYTDIIITLKKGRKLCLDPNRKQGMRIVSGQQLMQKPKRGNKQKKNKQQA